MWKSQTNGCLFPLFKYQYQNQLRLPRHHGDWAYHLITIRPLPQVRSEAETHLRAIANIKNLAEAAQQSAQQCVAIRAALRVAKHDEEVEKEKETKRMKKEAEQQEKRQHRQAQRDSEKERKKKEKEIEKAKKKQEKEQAEATAAAEGAVEKEKNKGRRRAKGADELIEGEDPPCLTNKLADSEVPVTDSLEAFISTMVHGIPVQFRARRFSFEKNHRKARHCWSQTLEQCFSSSSTWMEGTFVCLCGRGSKQRWCVEEKQGLHPRSDGLHEWIKSWPASTVLPGRTSHGRNWWVWPLQCDGETFAWGYSWKCGEADWAIRRCISGQDQTHAEWKSRCTPKCTPMPLPKGNVSLVFTLAFFHMCTTRWREQRQWRWWTLRM